MATTYTVERASELARKKNSQNDIVIDKDGTMLLLGIEHSPFSPELKHPIKKVHIGPYSYYLSETGFFVFTDKSKPPKVINKKIYQADLNPSGHLTSKSMRSGDWVLLLIRNAESYTCSNESALVHSVEISDGMYDFLILFELFSVKSKITVDVKVVFDDELRGVFCF